MSQESKVFYAYTPFKTVVIDRKRKKRVNNNVITDTQNFKIVPDERAVIAIKKVENSYVYGISICSISDNWDKAKGREIAEKRLSKNFGKIPISESVLKMASLVGPNRTTLNLLDNLVNSVSNNTNKYKRKIESFEKKHRKALPVSRTNLTPVRGTRK